MNPSNKIILDLCGGTGSWSKPYKDAGYDVRNITLPNWDITTFNPQSDRIYFYNKINDSSYLEIKTDEVYGILIASPCNQLSFCRTNAKNPRDLKHSLEIAQVCLNIIWECQMRLKKDTQKKAPLAFWAWENPRCMLEWFLGKPAFEFQPYEFGDNYKKKTHLWGCFNEPKKNPIKCDKPKFDKLKTKEIAPEYYGKLTRQERRAITPQGFAQAFFKANQ